MPFKQVEYGELSKNITEEPSVFVTSLGNTIIEIQGELVLPTEKPDALSPEDDEKYIQVDNGVLQDAIKFGRLELEENKATLFIGTSQRLIGEIKKVNPPLALLKFPTDSHSNVKILDIIKHKIIFTGRPLPIM